MGIGQIEAGKAYVRIYGDDSPLQQSIRNLRPEIRAQGEALARVGESAASAFIRGASEIANATNKSKVAATSFNIAAIASNEFSKKTESALQATAEATKATATATQQLVNQTAKAQPAAKGFAAAINQIARADVTLANGAFGVASIVQALKGGGEHAKPLLSILTGIVGKAQDLKATKLSESMKSAAGLGAPKVGDGSGLPVDSKSGPASTGGITVSELAKKFNEEKSAVRRALQKIGASAIGKLGSANVYDGSVTGELDKHFAAKNAPNTRPAAGTPAKSSTESVRNAINGSTTNLLGMQTVYKGLETAGTKAFNSIGKSAAVNNMTVKTYAEIASDAMKMLNNDTVKFAAGFASGAVVGTIQGITKSLYTMGRVGTIAAVNVAGGMAGFKGAWSPSWGKLSPLQKTANNALGASLMFGSKEQRAVAKQMSLQADAAAVGEAFGRGWLPGFAKYAQVGIPRAISGGLRGMAGLPLAATRGLIGMFTGSKSAAKGTDDLGKAATTATSKLSFLQRSMDSVKRSATGMGGAGSGAAKFALGVGGVLAAVAGVTSKSREGAVERMEGIGASASANKRTVESTSQLDFAATSTGTSLKTLDKAFDELDSTIKDGIGGKEAAVETFNKLGLSAERLKGMDIDDKMKRVGQALANIKDPLERDRLAIKLLGDSGAELIPMLTDLQALRGQATANNAVVSLADVEAAKQMSQAMSALKSVVTSAWNQIGAASIRSTTAWFSGAVKVIQKNQQLTGVVLKIAAALAAAAGAFVLISVYGPPVMAALTATVTALSGALVAGLAAVASPIGLTVAAIGLGVAAWMRFTESGQAAAAWFGQNLSEIGGIFSETWGGIIAAIGSGELTLAAEIALAGVKAAFFQTLNMLGISWTGIMEVMYGAWSLLSDAVVNGWAVIQSAFATVSTNIAMGWTVLAGGIDKIWSNVWASILQTFNSASTAIGKWMTWLYGKASGMSDKEIKDIQDTQDEMSAETHKSAESKRQTIFTPEMISNLNEVDQIGKEKQARIESNRKAGLASNEQALADRMAALLPDSERLSGQKAELKRLSDKAKAVDPEKKPPHFVPDSQMESAGKQSVAGTFSAMAAMGMGGPSPLNEIANETRESRKILAEIRRNQTKGGKRSDGDPVARFT